GAVRRRADEARRLAEAAQGVRWKEATCTISRNGVDRSPRPACKDIPAGTGRVGEPRPGGSAWLPDHPFRRPEGSDGDHRASPEQPGSAAAPGEVDRQP